MTKFTKLTLFSIGFLLLGVMCGISEQALYGGRLDAEGVLQESFFLPLTFLFLAIGAVLLLAAVLRQLFRKTL